MAWQHGRLTVHNSCVLLPASLQTIVDQQGCGLQSEFKPYCHASRSPQHCNHVPDDTGIESAWHLDKIVIHNSATNETVVFKCKAWLDATSGEGKLERNFYPLTDCTYKIELQTSDLRGAGTSANGVISLLGSRAEAGPFQLANDGKTFQRGSLDVMTLDSVPDIGAIQQVMFTAGMSQITTLLACFSPACMARSWHL